MIRAAIVGTTGYTGLELARILLDHPKVTLTRIFSRQHAGIAIGDVFPHLSALPLVFEVFDPTTFAKDPQVEVVFLALPHGQSQKYMGQLLTNPGLKIIDLSADFRLPDAKQYATYYGHDHEDPNRLGSAAVGFSEINFEAIQAAKVVANPGCYATSVVLGLHPLASAGLIQTHVVVDSKSGVTGAGKALKESSLFCEANEAFMPYGTYSHRHVPEMENTLGISVLFSPHLVPMNRGILSSMYVPLEASTAVEDVVALYKKAYLNRPCVHVLEKGIPSTRWVKGSNVCMIGFKWIEPLKTLVVFSALDNLIKGASGQAIQNMNIQFGLPEGTGLPLVAHYL
ncbi:MAG: N-acetyl-gamma-glutamyl-phosphate reductase [Candidatus Margulisiibacteriota bacterium]